MVDFFVKKLNIGPQERPTEAENALLLPVKVLEGEASLSVRLAEETGHTFSVPYGMGERATSDDGAISLDAAVTAWTMSEPQRALDPQQLHTIRINGNPKTQKLKFIITRVGWATF